MYRFEFVKRGAVFDLSVLRISEKGRAKSSNNGLSISIFDGKGRHLHFAELIDFLISNNPISQNIQLLIEEEQQK